MSFSSLIELCVTERFFVDPLEFLNAFEIIPQSIGQRMTFDFIYFFLVFYVRAIITLHSQAHLYLMVHMHMKSIWNRVTSKHVASMRLCISAFIN